MEMLEIGSVILTKEMIGHNILSTIVTASLNEYR